jgi:hypothetical protein
MIGEAARQAGARITATGDTAQLGAAEAGGMFHLLAREVPAAQLHDRDFAGGQHQRGPCGAVAGCELRVCLPEPYREPVLNRLSTRSHPFRVNITGTVPPTACDGPRGRHQRDGREPGNRER